MSWSALQSGRQTAAIEYKQTLRDLGNLTARIEYSYRSDFYYTSKTAGALRRTASAY